MKLTCTALCLLLILALAVGAEKFTVEENSGSSSEVARVLRDGGSDYSFQENDGFFIIDESGIIRTNGTLDRERVVELYGKDLLTYTINYRNNGSRSSFNVEIQVEDVNDNPPQFDLPPVLALFSNQVGPVLQLQASDPDRGENATVDFAITGGDEDGLFELLFPAEGDVAAQTNDRLSLTENPPTGQVFFLQLSATDRGTPETKSTVVTLRVNISAAASDVPVFPQSSYNYRVPTSAVEGHIVGAVSAMDPDSMVNSSIVYYLDQSHFAFAKANTAFSVNRETGIIRLKQIPPSTLRISFVVIAENTNSVVGVELRAWTHVHVVFFTGNAPPLIVLEDDSPVPPTVTFVENLPSFTLPRMLIKDNDGIANSSVELSPQVAHSFRHQMIATFNLITFSVTQIIDREMIPSIDVTFFATDSQGKTGSVSVTVIIGDENDNYPIFEQSEYLEDVEETLAVGTEVLRISANDPDDGDNGMVAYYITNVHPTEAAILFHIDPTNGTLILVGRLNYEKPALRVITMHVNASDGGHPPKMASTSVTITVLDVNEAPVFVPDPPTTVDVIYNMTSRDVLASFTAQDDDATDGVSYSISCQTSLPQFLDINSQSGSLVLLALPDPFTEPIVCTISAEDSQTPPRSTELNVTVYYVRDECRDGPCANNGSCHNTRLGFSCSCPPTHIGRRCDIPVDPCAVHPCMNGGECTGTPKSTHYMCRCPPGFGGHDCEVEPISFDQSGFARFSLPSDVLTTDVELSLEFYTASSYGLLFYLQSEGGRFVSVEVVKGRVQLRSSLYSKTVTSATEVGTRGQWYRVEVNEKNEWLSMVDLAGHDRMTTNASDGDRAVNEESPTFLALGGIPDIQEVLNQLSVYDFVGCIGHVVVNGYLLDVAMPTKSNALKSDCAMPTIPPTSAPLLDSSCVVCEDVDAGVCDYVLGRVPQACSQASSSPESYTGSGYSTIRFTGDFFLYAEVLRRGEEGEQRTSRAVTSLADPKFEISLLFASKADGILWAAVHGDNYHILSISSGKLTYAIYHSGIFRLFSLQQQYSDGQWHSVTVVQTSEGVSLRTNVEVQEFTVTPIPGVILTNDTSELQVGGVSDKMADHVNTTAIDYNNPSHFSGCLMNLTINHLLVPLDEDINGMTEVLSAPNTFGNTATCPSLDNSAEEQLDVIVIAAVAAGIVVVFIVVLVVVGCVCCVCCKHRGRKGKFDVRSSSDELGNDPTSMMTYNDQGGEFHPDEDEDKKQRTIGEFHMTQASIDSSTISSSQRMQFALASSASQETGFHSDMPVLGGSSTDIKESDYSGEDESTLSRSETKNGAVKRLSHTRSKQTRLRHESLTSTEERVLDPPHLKDSRVLSPSVEDGLGSLDALPKMVRPSAPLPLTPPTYQGEEHHLKSLSAAHVTPINYWEEAYRMKPAVDTDEQSLHLSQLISEPLWIMESPSPCTSVVSSALEDGRLFSRHHTFNSQGGVEEEAGMDNISMGTDDSINRFGRNPSSRQRTPNYNTPPYHKYYTGRIPFSSRSAAPPFHLHPPVGLPPPRETLHTHQEMPHFSPFSTPQHFPSSSSPLEHMSQGRGTGRSAAPWRHPANIPSPLRDYSHGASPASQPPPPPQPAEFSPLRHNFQNSHALAVSPKISPAQVAAANGGIRGQEEPPAPVNEAHHRPSSQPLLDNKEKFDRLPPYHQTSSLNDCLANSNRPHKGRSAVDV